MKKLYLRLLLPSLLLIMALTACGLGSEGEAPQTATPPQEPPASVSEPEVNPEPAQESEPQVSVAPAPSKTEADDKVQTINFDETIVFGDMWELTLSSAEFTKEATIKGSRYRYEAKDGEVYIVLSGTMKSTHTEKLRIDYHMNVNVMYDSKYNYNGHISIGEGLDDYIKPLQEKQVIIYSALPESAKDSGAPIELRISAIGEPDYYVREDDADIIYSLTFTVAK